MKQAGIDPENIIAYGESLGGVVAVNLAAQKEVACLILDSTLSSAADFVRARMPYIPTFLLWTKMDSLSKVNNLKMPKLFIHSPQDEIIPYKLGRKLFDAAPEPKEFLTIHGSHNEGFYQSQDIYVRGIAEFLKKWNLIS